MKDFFKQLDKILLLVLLLILGISFFAFFFRKDLVYQGLLSKDFETRANYEGIFIYELDDESALKILEKIFHSENATAKKRILALVSSKFEKKALIFSILKRYLISEKPEIQKNIISQFEMLNMSLMNKETQDEFVGILINLFEKANDLSFKTSILLALGDFDKASKRVVSFLIKSLDIEEMLFSSLAGLEKLGENGRNSIQVVQKLLKKETDSFKKYRIVRCLLTIDPQNEMGCKLYKELIDTKNKKILDEIKLIKSLENLGEKINETLGRKEEKRLKVKEFFQKVWENVGKHLKDFTTKPKWLKMDERLLNLDKLNEKTEMKSASPEKKTSSK